MEGLWKNVPTFPQFREIVLEDKRLLDFLFTQVPPVISEFTFTNLFIWRHAYGLKASRFEKFLCLLADQGDASFFFPPIGQGYGVECYRALLEFLLSQGIPPKIARVPEHVIVSRDWEPEGMVAELDRAQCDYLYLTKDLVSLEGRRYHRKRNHIKQFKERYNYQYTSLTPRWIEECLRLETEWCDVKHCDLVPGLSNELVAIREALHHCEALGIRGGAILIDGKLEAFTLGEPLNSETVVIHIEKANPAFDGLYPTVNQAFLEKEWVDYLYVNREQDLGEEGLRKAKESYFPHHLVNKYTLTFG